jgi:hypothetical protein
MDPMSKRIQQMGNLCIYCKIKFTNCSILQVFLNVQSSQIDSYGSVFLFTYLRVLNDAVRHPQKRESG